MADFTTKEKLAEIRRELGMRHHVYGTSGSEKQRRQVAILKAIEADYVEKLKAEEPKLDFPGHD